ncbi:MAG: hypothetical protein H0S81_10050 [Desulfotignum balticum]|jgi:hypothetical protein|uniref:Uncharacterized protein n=1 Tax=Desulfotignum balticum TaxID=115781 RepID=A0A931CWZ0_9BACT|nr:hypothetical protein [Desulfotignum balticum]
MKQYVIDGLRPQDYLRLKEYLDEYTQVAGIVGIYWLPLEKEVLTPVQADHRDCAPHVFALKLEQSSLACELLVRTQKQIRCDCMAYATRDQRNWLIDQTDAILEKLDIRI